MTKRERKYHDRKKELNFFNSLVTFDGICPKCECCETVWEQCWSCGGDGGRGWEDLQSEDPLWYDENDFIICDICNGKGGFNVCGGKCDENGKH